MSALVLRRLGKVLAVVGLVWVILVMVGALGIMASARTAESVHLGPPVRLLAQAPQDVPRHAAAAQAQADSSVRPLSNGPPTVNGLFYGDGDYARYLYYAENPGRSTLYYTKTGDVLYLALVMSSTFNDLVFGRTGQEPDRAYLQSAGWSGQGNAHQFKHLDTSDHSIWNLCCGSCGCWTWAQDVLRDADGDEDVGEADWLSDPYGEFSGTGLPPPGFITSASSLQWNLNWHAVPTQPTHRWDVTLGGTRTSNTTYKSPDAGPAEGGTAQDVTDAVDNWPLWSSYWEWEWHLVYEVSIDISNCAGCPITAWPVNGHNSPSKTGEEDAPMYDWGDNPDTGAGTGAGNYQTLNSDLGPSHVISACSFGLHMGNIVDPETDGQPSTGAVYDDQNPAALGQDDEDGVDTADLYVDPDAETHTVDVVITNKTGQTAYLYGYIDFNGDGDFADTNEVAWTSTSVSGTNIALQLTFTVPDDMADVMYSRFRLSTNQAAVSSPTGAAPDGEVEDYPLQGEPTSVQLTRFDARAGLRQINLYWETAQEVDQLGFNLYRAAAVDGPRTRVNEELIPSRIPPGSPVGASYSFEDCKVRPNCTYYYWLEDLDIYGRSEWHGPVEVRLEWVLPGRDLTMPEETKLMPPVDPARDPAVD